jgi:catechol 2,3-dioxygenase-like lactoylglutathione lyase family enzyme
MPMARFKDFCIDAVDPVRMGPFWAAVSGCTWVPDDAGEGQLTGVLPVWINRVPEPRTVKQRVHLDVYTPRLVDLTALGSEVIVPQADGRTWTVMADPEGGEYCAFVREDGSVGRVHAVVVDSGDPAAQARWWGTVLGVAVVDDDRGFSTLVDVPGLPVATMDFLPVPEAKTVKNRIHWDVLVEDVAPLLAAGAEMLRPRDDEIGWHVLADPEGNEFCAFVEGATT